MQIQRHHSITIGLFYIVAAVSSIIAVLLYQPILSNQWYLTVSQGQGALIQVGIFNDLLLVFSAIGTAVMFFPYLRKIDEHIALFHLFFRVMEAVVIMIGILGILGLYSLSSAYSAGQLVAIDALQPVGIAFKSLHRWTFVIGPNLMLGINTCAYSTLLLKGKLTPKPLAVMGIGTAILVFIAGLLDLFGVIEPNAGIKGILALPVGLFEMSLAVYLIRSGLKGHKSVPK